MNVVHVIGYLLRTKRQASQKDVARLAKIHPVALSKIERGAHAELGVGTFVRLAEAIGEKPGELLESAVRIASKLPDDVAPKELGARVAELAATLVGNEPPFTWDEGSAMPDTLTAQPESESKKR